MSNGLIGVKMPRFSNKQEQRDYEKSIEGDVKDFMKEVAGIKKTEFPVGNTTQWRKDKEEVKKRKYDDDEKKRIEDEADNRR